MQTKTKLLKYFLIILISFIAVIFSKYYFRNQIEAIDNGILDLKYQAKETLSKNKIKISKYILLVDDNDISRQKLGYSPLIISDWNKYLNFQFPQYSHGKFY